MVTRKTEKLFVLTLLTLFCLNTAMPVYGFRFSPKAKKIGKIKWNDWDENVFQRAEKTKKPILLSLSAVWCHWCHVMDETTYSDERVITFINTNLIPVRVDADQRPDIDNIYNQGGWPSTVLLTPGGEIIDGGTFFRPDEMLQWLKYNLNRYPQRWNPRKKELKSHAPGSNFPILNGKPDKRDLEEINAILIDSFDKEHGGFGQGQKFPNPGAIEFLLTYYFWKEQKSAMNVVIKTLDEMAGGKIFDSREGGFFRYSTKPDWSAPHYEKMLSVNARIIRNYLHAYMLFGIPRYLKVAETSISYIRKYLYDGKEKMFRGSQAADERYYRSPERSSLTPPPVDMTSYADSSAEMISTLTAAYSATGEIDYLRWAEEATQSLMERLYSVEGGVYHYWDGSPHLPGLLRDNILVINALIDMYNNTGKGHYLESAEGLLAYVIKNYYQDGHFRLYAGKSIKSPARAGVMNNFRWIRDNFTALLVLSRLEPVIPEELTEIVVRTAEHLRPFYKSFEIYSGTFGQALFHILNHDIEIKIVMSSTKDSLMVLNILNSQFLPGKTIRIYNPVRDGETMKKEGIPEKEGVYLCALTICAPPIDNIPEIKTKTMEFLQSIRQRH